MKESRGLWIHLALLAVAGGLAYSSFQKGDEATQGRQAEVILWNEKLDRLSLVRYEGEDLRVRIEPRKDEVGRYYRVEIVKEDSDPSKVDAGTPPAAPKKRVFLSVDPVQELAEGLAPLKSYRQIGRIDDKRRADFGLDKVQGRLFVEFGSTKRSLTLGSLTPGSSDMYARDDATGLVHAVSAEVMNRLRYGDSRLYERDVHGFDIEEPTRITVSAQGKVRRLVRIEGKKQAYADAASPTVQDETAGNWLGKLARLRPSEFVEKPEGLGSALFRVEYLDPKQRLGYAELFRAAGTEKKFYLKTERTRWYVEVAKTTGEQLEQDLGSIVK